MTPADAVPKLVWSISQVINSAPAARTTRRFNPGGNMGTARIPRLVSGLALLLCMIALPVAATAGTLEEVKKRGELIVGVRYDMPPFGTVDPQGALQGIDVELAKQIAGKLGVKIKFQQVTAQTRIPLLLNGNVDLIAAGLAKTEERAKVVQYSSIYIETGTVFLVLKDSPIKSWQDVKGKTVATIQGSSYLGLLRKKTTDFQSLVFQEYPQAILAVEQGRADTLMVEDATAVNLIKGREEKFKLVGRPRDFEAYEIGLGMRKNDEEWVKYVNSTLGELWKSGELKRIVAPYGLRYDADFRIPS
ncbi:MAG: transporter substrate-binding domain-containing protein [Vicinamibacterales bacterium]